MKITNIEFNPDDRVTEYALSVVNKEITANIGELHYLACKRHVDDLLKSRNDADYPYHWDWKAAKKIIDFAEMLTIGEGFDAKPLRLLDSQAFDFGCIIGWKKQNGYRRFRKSYLSMARQNGKTMTNGVFACFFSAFSGYKYGELFTVATMKRQARLAWEEAKKFIESDKDLIFDKYGNPDGYFKVMDYKSTIEAVNTHCTLSALSKESGLQDGFRSLYASVDEIHQHKDGSIVNALTNGTRTMPETLISMITTRGDNLNSYCKEVDDYAIKILKGLATADDFFVDIYALDEGDDPFNEEVWGKANPYLITQPDSVEVLRQDVQTARDMGGAKLRDMLIKSLNMWVENRDNTFISADDWQKSACDLTLEDMKDRECWVGLDLSSGGDLTSFALEFPLDDGSYYLHTHSFMPLGRLAEHEHTDLAPYSLWQQQGLLTCTGGVDSYRNDYGFIVKKLRDLRDQYGFKYKGIGVDPHNFDGMREQIEELGVPILVIVQSAKSLNDATVDMQLLCKSGKLKYNRHQELFTWSMLNARLTFNSFEECKIDKRPNARTKRIDPIDAVIDAHSCMLKCDKSEIVDVNAQLGNYLAAMGWKTR